MIQSYCSVLNENIILADYVILHRPKWNEDALMEPTGDMIIYKEELSGCFCSLSGLLYKAIEGDI